MLLTGCTNEVSVDCAKNPHGSTETTIPPEVGDAAIVGDSETDEAGQIAWRKRIKLTRQQPVAGEEANISRDVMDTDVHYAEVTEPTSDNKVIVEIFDDGAAVALSRDNGADTVTFYCSPPAPAQPA